MPAESLDPRQRCDPARRSQRQGETRRKRFPLRLPPEPNEGSSTEDWRIDIASPPSTTGRNEAPASTTGQSRGTPTHPQATDGHHTAEENADPVGALETS